MKKFLYSVIIALISSVCYSQNISVHQKNETNVFSIYDVDSITHNTNSTLNIYHKGQQSILSINNIDSITISTEQIEFYKILSEQINGWDAGIYCKSSNENDFYIVSKTDSIEAEGGTIRVCLNSFTNEDINKTTIFNYDSNGRLYDIIYYGIQFKAENVSDSIMFVAYDSSGNYLGDFNVSYEIIDFAYSAGYTRGDVVMRQPPHPFWINSKGRISLPKIKDFGRKAYALADLYGKKTSDVISTAINLSEGRYGEIIKNFLIGNITAFSGLSFFPIIIAEAGINNMSNHFYEQEKQKYLGDSQIEIFSIKRIDDKHINVQGFIDNVSSIPSTYSISSNIYGNSWPNVVYWGVAEGESGQPGYFLNEECSNLTEVEGNYFSYTFYIPKAPGKTLYFRPFLAPKDKIEEIEDIPNPFTCIRYGERKEYYDFYVELSNLKQNECFKTNTGYEVSISIDGNIPGVFNDLSNWGICVKTQNGPEQRYYAKNDNNVYPPTNTTFNCEIVIDQSEITKEGDNITSVVTITPFYSLWNAITPSFFDSKRYRIALKGKERSCPDNNHPHEVDLGLPSGTKWACCNVDAALPEDVGGFYAWGETTPGDIDDDYWESYQYFDHEYYDGWSRHIVLKNIGENICGTDYDVANVKWGEGWKLPTYEQTKELVKHCDSYYYVLNGIEGYSFYGPNGNHIFIPFDKSRGIDCWTGTLAEEDTIAFVLYADPHAGAHYNVRSSRSDRNPVRPVK